MRFLPGRVSLSDISGGTLASGVVPFPRLIKFSAYNTGSNFIITAAVTDFVTWAAGNVAVGDYVLGFATGLITKGATAGATNAQIRTNGSTATFSGGDVTLSSYLAQESSTLIGGSFGYNLSALWVVTGAGSLQLNWAASSAGSNSTVNRCGLYGVVLAGA